MPISTPVSYVGGEDIGVPGTDRQMQALGTYTIGSSVGNRQSCKALADVGGLGAPLFTYTHTPVLY